MSEEPVSGRRRSGRSTDKGRAKALELLKSKHRPELKLEDPIYDTVADEDYDRLVAARQESARNFIVDDDGLGYVDEGEEEDWARSALPPSSDDDDESNASRKRRNKVVKRETEVVKKKTPPASSLTAAAALMGKQKLSAMFTSSAFRKNERKNFSGSGSIESMVDDIIAEFAPDEKDRQERRRRRGVMAVPVASGFRVSEPEKGADVGVEVKLRENGEVQIKNGRVKIENGEIKVDNCEEEKVVNLKSETAAQDSGVVTMDIEMHVGEVKVEPISEKKVPSSTLNARIKTDKDVNMVSATDRWKALCEDGGRCSNKPEVGGGESAILDENSDFVLDSDGSLPFYLIDVHEESYGANSGTLYLFGKVKTGTTYQSCCIVVKNMQRCIYAIPKSTVFQSAEISNLEKEHSSSSISHGALRTKLQEMSSDLKSEIAGVLVDHNISSFTMTPVKRGYAFERVDIPMGEQYVLKISYPFKDPSLPSDLTGDLFYALFGTNTSALELFLLKRKIKGPSWLSISRFSVSPPHERVSWCKYEMVVDFPKDIRVSTPKKVLEIPTVTVTAINLKTIINQEKNVSEIVSASVICCRQVKIDGPMIVSECERLGILSYFSIIRKLDGGIFPMGFDKQVADRNSKAGSKVLAMESSERALLNRLMIELHKLDSDVLVGHNISGFDLDVLLHRSQACTVPSSMWSKIGRLKRSIMPKLTKGNALYGSGASHGIISCIAGRLLCDTYLSSRDLVKEVSYSLTQLAKTQLNKDRQEISPHDIPHMFQASVSLLNFVDCGETDAWLSLELMFHLSILPLTRQLTNISGNLWGKTLQGARAQRVEFLLLHAFHAKKYIVPDKSFVKSKAPSSSKRERNSGATFKDAEDINTDDAVLDSDPQLLGRVKNKKSPAYVGGLVLEPKKGLYDKIVLLLDFNSLYPSIIQEYNICFTTIETTLDGSAPSLPSSRITGVLPELLKNLVERRRLVKSWLKTATGMMVQQFDIQQQALKLTANSIYGCLGFPYSRFYAKPIAELITLQGREILQSTVDLVQNVLNLEVIYGDTDSIMIHSGLDDVIKAKAVATKVIKEVNKKYRCLEIDLDGLYKRMLLLKKKKYAAVKLQFKDGKQHEVIERKGLDMVRRDWSLLSKELGDFCLSQILSGGSCDEVVETIHNYLMEVQKEMKNGEIELEKYVITKTLTKPPEEYPDGKNQPHVQVALRLRQSGYTSGCSAGDTVPYVICYEQGTSSSSSGGIAGRARHPDELKRDNENWTVDIGYYLSQQIHPVVARLCASIQGTSPARLADCLGLDSSKFQTNTESTSNDPSDVLASMLDDDDRYHGCEPLRLSCPSCSSSFDCAPLSSLFSSMSNKKTTDSDNKNKSDLNFWQRMRCPRCPEDVEGCKISAAMMANQVKRQAENFISMYYKGVMMCDDEMCKHTTRNLTLRVIGYCERGTVCPNYPRCNGHLVRQYTEAELYKQLSYFCYIFDIKRCTEKMDQNTRLLFEKELTMIQPIISLASSTIKKIRDKSAYGWVRLEDLSVSV